MPSPIRRLQPAGSFGFQQRNRGTYLIGQRGLYTATNRPLAAVVTLVVLGLANLAFILVR